MSMRDLFEKELKNKLLMKTVGNQSEEIVLLKAFKYFDLSNTNLSDKETFIKVLMKIGITGFTEENITSIFDFYDTDNIGKINYKDFIGFIYKNPSIMDNPEKLNEINPQKQNYPYQSHFDENNNYNQFQSIENNNQNYNSDNSVNLNKTIDDIIEIIRNRIKRRGIRCIISLENNFRFLDDDNSQTIDYEAFEKTAQDFRFGITYDELQKLFNFFNKEKNGRIDYDEFIRIIRGQMSNSRKALIEQIFDTFNPDQDGFVHITKINKLFNPENHPDVINGIKNPNVIYKEFIDTFEGNHTYLNGDEAQYGNVDVDEFCDYYDSVSMTIEKDDEFEDIVKGVWLNEVMNYNNQQEEKSNLLRSKKRFKNENNPNEKEEQEKNEYYNINNINEEEDEKKKSCK